MVDSKSVEQVISTVADDCPSEDVCQSSSVEAKIVAEATNCFDETESSDSTNKQVCDALHTIQESNATL